MKKNIILLLFTCISLNSFSQEEALVQKNKNKDSLNIVKEASPTIVSENDKITTYYLINSPEKKAVTGTQKDPSLTSQGFKRSEKWAKVLGSVKLDAAYAINTMCAKQAAQTISESQKIKTYGLDSSNLYDVSFKYNTKGNNVLIVADNVTTIKLANLVLGKEKFLLVENNKNFGRLYILTVNENSKTSTVLTID